MKRNDFKSEVYAGFIFTLVFLSCMVRAQAGSEEIKAYKAAFPDAQLKCAVCHSVAMPRTGAAGLNDYGQAVLAANLNPTVETFRQLGKAEDFKK